MQNAQIQNRKLKVKEGFGRKNILIVTAQYIESFTITMAREIITKCGDKKSQVQMYHTDEASSDSQEELQIM